MHTYCVILSFHNLIRRAKLLFPLREEETQVFKVLSSKLHGHLMAAIKVGSRDFIPKQWASKRCMAHYTVSCMPSDEPGRGPTSSVTAILFQEAMNEKSCNHCVPEGNEGTLVTPPVQFLWPLWSTWHVRGMLPGGSGNSEMRQVFGVFCCREPVGEKRVVIPTSWVWGFLAFGNPHKSLHVSVMLSISACAKKRFPFIISVVPKCWSTDPSDSIMTFSTDCS